MAYSRNEELAEIAAEAHERRMARRQRFIESNPNAVNQWERAGVERRQHDRGLTGREEKLQDHEMEMLKQRGENDFRVAEQKRFGMAEQGMGAAEINANASITNTEREWAGRENIATKQADFLY